MIGAFLAVLVVLGCVPTPTPVEGWASLAALPTPRGELAAAALDGRIYVLGGLLGAGESSDVVEVYDVALDSWSSAPSMPVALNHLAAASFDGKIYVSGGNSNIMGGAPSKEFYELDPTTRLWTRRADMPYARSAHGMVALGDRLYVIGGVSDEDATAVLEYDPGRDAWAVRASIPTPREHLAVVASERRIYAIGGRWANVNLSIVEVYNASTDSWTGAAPLPTARSGIAAGTIDGRIYVVGGEDPLSLNTIFGQNEVYDLEADRWSSAASLPTPRHGVAGVVVDNRFYVIGGATLPGALSFMSWSGAVEVYTP